MAEPRTVTSEYHDEYSETLGAEFRKLQDALLSDTIAVLTPRQPLQRDETARVGEALDSMLAEDRIAVVVVDGMGRLAGIVTDRDLLGRAGAARRETDLTPLTEVMTPNPETLRPDDRVCYALNRMMTTGCRTVPVVDGDGRPISIVTVDDIAKWLAALFPEAILNLRPGDRLKRPAERDGG
jgi:CBS domain-containing protein